MRPTVADHQVEIAHLQVQYIVPAAHPSPDRLKNRLDEVMTGIFSPALSAAFDQLLKPGDPGVWLVRRLAAEMDINAAWQPEAIARRCALGIIQEMAQVFQGGPDGHTVLYFQDYPAYLAQFLVDVANDNAWNKWYYNAFDGLRLLPNSAAIRTAVLQDPAAGRDALRSLSRERRTAIIKQLTAPDGLWVLEGLTGQESQDDLPAALRGLWAAWEEAGIHAPGNSRRTGHALLLCLAAWASGTRPPEAAARTAAFALVELARRAADDSADGFAKLITALEHKDIAGLYLLAGTSAEHLIPLLRIESAWLKETGRQLRRKYHRPNSKGSAASLERGYTPFGGLFLLLPLLDALPVAQWTISWPQKSTVSAVRLVRLLLILKCLGGERFRQAFNDPLLRDMLGVHPALSPDLLSEWALSIPEKGVDSLLTSYFTWQQSEGAVEGKTLWLAEIDLAGGSKMLLFDQAQAMWIRLGPSNLAWPAAVIPDLEGLQLICDPGLVSSLKSLFKHVTILGNDQTIVTGNEIYPSRLARLEKAGTEIAYLAAPKSLRLPPLVDDMLCILAQGLLRRFARRLPGFGLSSLPHIFHNFLDIRAAVEPQSTGWAVQLSAPPLNLILNMTGLARQNYTVSWLEGRSLHLTQAGL